MKFNYTTFKTNDSFYLFDGVSSNLFSISENIFHNHEKLIVDIDKLSKNYNHLLDDEKEFYTAIDNGLFVPNDGVDEIQYWYNPKKIINDIEKNYINHVMIEMTQDCNMRCKYCVYGGHYPGEHTHNSQKIANKTLLNAVKIITDSRSDSPEKILNFYGGEPFLEFNKIKMIVEEVGDKHPEIKFYFTTNGTLLNNKIAKWFTENKQVNLFISFGGNKASHDQLRVLKNNTPTYEIIKKNLISLKMLDEEAYKTRVHFLFNIYSDKQLFHLDEIINNEPIFKDMIGLPEISVIDTSSDDGEISKLCNNMGNKIDNLPSPIDEYVRRLKKNDKHNVFVKYYDELFLDVHKRVGSNKKVILSGVCKPFINRIFIETNGNVHICENYRKDLGFGNVNETVCLNKISDVLANYLNDRKEYCSNCWASKLCTLCFKDFNKTAKIKNEEYCDNERSRLKKIFAEYCKILEKDNFILDHLNNYVTKE